MKYGKLKDSNNKQKTKMTISSGAICAGHIGTYTREKEGNEERAQRIFETISGAVISNEVRHVLEDRRDKIQQEIKELNMLR